MEKNFFITLYKRKKWKGMKEDFFISFREEEEIEEIECIHLVGEELWKESSRIEETSRMGRKRKITGSKEKREMLEERNRKEV